jgi:hypothetical protein
MVNNKISFGEARAIIKVRYHSLRVQTGVSILIHLETSVVSLVNSVAEYCPPVGLNSAYTKNIDVQLNRCIRIITDTLKSTPMASGYKQYI